MGQMHPVARFRRLHAIMYRDRNALTLFQRHRQMQVRPQINRVRHPARQTCIHQRKVRRPQHRRHRIAH